LTVASTLFGVSHKDQATPLFNRLAAKLEPQRQRGLVLAWAILVQNEAARNARAKGGKRFWRDLAKTIHAVSTGTTSAQVQVDHVAAAQKERGGPIEAKNAAMLTIPVKGSEAEGRRASEFPELFRIGRMLVRKEGGVIEPLFWLVKKTKRQRPDPFMPQPARIAELAEQMAKAKLGLT
jgi:hypothetical protein